ncbi:MAG: tRNA uridine-5-carboxymethylaminomethyl(34) synthesis GTPase MnmE [Candidatus Omnitrophica bacterium]|nr:tRNA uridine-5-carboxymethylaminomethyl(34) synthesis GTPase MnmE [Candidatus Omnitrophota bacterium]
MAALASFPDTIVAMSTPVGQGAVGIVRLSGPQALRVVESVFASKNGKPLSDAKTFTLKYGWVVRDKEAFEKSGRSPLACPAAVLDEVVVSLMRSPHSYTREDVVEINSHGGPRVLSLILEILLEKGARLAQPGEFTKRAFLNGRLDLAQAEAVLDIIQAKSDLALKNSLTQLAGELSRKMKVLRQEMLDVLAEIEARLDFSEEDIQAVPYDVYGSALEGIRRRLADLLEKSFCGRIVREGLKVAICGRPNAGKSSLLNALLGAERAIVTAIAGTTRDTIEECVNIRGLAVCLIDTAGVLEARDEIERLALARTRNAIEDCDIVLFVLDGSGPLEDQDAALLSFVKPSKKIIGVVNKSDLPRHADRARIRDLFRDRAVVEVSALTRDNIAALEEEILRSVFHDPGILAADVLVSNVRHIDILKAVVASLEHAQESLKNHLSLEFAAMDLRGALNRLGELTGEVFHEELLETIFSKFCIGK